MSVVRIGVLGYGDESKSIIVLIREGLKNIGVKNLYISALPESMNRINLPDGEMNLDPYINIISPDLASALRILSLFHSLKIHQNLIIFTNHCRCVITITAEEIKDDSWRSKYFDLHEKVCLSVTDLVHVLRRNLRDSVDMMIIETITPFVVCKKISARGVLPAPEFRSGRRDLEWYLHFLLENEKPFCFEVERQNHGDPLMLYEISLMK